MHPSICWFIYTQQTVPSLAQSFVQGYHHPHIIWEQLPHIIGVPHVPQVKLIRFSVDYQGNKHQNENFPCKKLAGARMSLGRPKNLPFQGNHIS